MTMRVHTSRISVLTKSYDFLATTCAAPTIHGLPYLVLQSGTKQLEDIFVNLTVFLHTKTTLKLILKAC